jgi:hypothetical protein
MSVQHQRKYYPEFKRNAVLPLRNQIVQYKDKAFFKWMSLSPADCERITEKM